MVQTLCDCLERIFMDIQPVQKHLQYQKEMDAMDAQKTSFGMFLDSFGRFRDMSPRASQTSPGEKCAELLTTATAAGTRPVAGIGSPAKERHHQNRDKEYQRTSGGRVFATWLDNWETCLILLGVFELYHWWKQPCKAALRWTWWTSTKTILSNPLLGANDVIPTNMVCRGQMGLHCCSASEDEFTLIMALRDIQTQQIWHNPEHHLKLCWEKNPTRFDSHVFKFFFGKFKKNLQGNNSLNGVWLLVRVHISCRFFSVCKMWEHDFMMNNTQFLKLPPNQAQWNFKQLIWLLD